MKTRYCSIMKNPCWAIPKGPHGFAGRFGTGLSQERESPSARAPGENDIRVPKEEAEQVVRISAREKPWMSTTIRPRGTDS